MRIAWCECWPWMVEASNSPEGVIAVQWVHDAAENEL